MGSKWFDCKKQRVHFYNEVKENYALKQKLQGLK